MKHEIQLLGLEEQALAKVATTLAVRAKLPILVYLRGELGTGKTTFVRAWLRALGVKSRICSPSYTLVEPYCTNQGNYYHFDLYRLHSAEELEMLGFRDYLAAGCLIEWPERANDYLPSPDLLIKLEFAQQERNLTLTALSESGKALIEGLQT